MDCKTRLIIFEINLSSICISKFKFFKIVLIEIKNENLICSVKTNNQVVWGSIAYWSTVKENKSIYNNSLVKDASSSIASSILDKQILTNNINQYVCHKLKKCN
jgi:hypothetical protein